VIVGGLAGRVVEMFFDCGRAGRLLFTIEATG